MNVQSERLRKRLRELRDFLNKSYFTAPEIVSWVSSSVAFFSSIGVNEAVISAFMSAFKHVEDQDVDKPMGVSMKAKHIGPFVQEPLQHMYTLGSQNMWSQGNIHSEAVYIHVAFETADNVISNLEDLQKLVPRSLLSSLKEIKGLTAIASSLELMEQHFESRDGKSLLEDSIALLESIFSLESSLVGLDLSAQINKLKGDSALLDKFGSVRPEILQAFHNFRILRNQMATHKSLPIDYDIPFAVATGAAHLAVMFLQIALATGKLLR